MRRQKRQNAKQQQQQRPLPLIRGSQLPPMATPPADYHPPCNLDIVSINPASSSSSASSPYSPLSAKDHVWQSSRSSTNPSPGYPILNQGANADGSVEKRNYVVDLSEFFPIDEVAETQDSHGNQFAFPESSIGPLISSSQQQGQDGSHTTWEGFDLGSLLDNADMSLQRREGGNGSLSLQGSSGVGAGDKGVEFSVTCSRSRLKAMVCHAFEGAMSETAGLSEEEPVTVTLRLRR